MRYTDPNVIDQINKAFLLADIADGTFMVVQQQWLVELTVYATREFDHTWVVEIAKLPDYADTICNSSHATGEWYKEFTTEKTAAYFDDSREAHLYMAEFMMTHQIDGV